MLPVSKDTLLRVVRRHVARDHPSLCVIGIDDGLEARAALRQHHLRSRTATCRRPSPGPRARHGRGLVVTPPRNHGHLTRSRRRRPCRLPIDGI
jgi:hypothetical protein